MKNTMLVLLLVLSFNAYSYERSDKLLWACQSELNSIEEGLAKSHCIGYLGGILDGVQLVFGVKPESKFFCPPASGISGDQQLRIVTKYLEDHPEELHKGARVLVLIAYSNAFPCK